MREQPKNQISPDGLKVWRLQEIIISAVCLLIVIAVAVLSYYFHWPYWISGVLGAVWLLGSIVTVFIIPKVRHKVWRYEVHEHEIDIQSGIFCGNTCDCSDGQSSARRYVTRAIIKKIQPGNGENFHGRDRSFDPRFRDGGSGSAERLHFPSGEGD
ncbi:Hypothetical protein YdbS [Bacillus subtilis subsp. subtilis str. BSP1]|nr:Hypothetical protein YdbS [Bacillus subtilis subsp. subtilis str. BSP1]